MTISLIGKPRRALRWILGVIAFVVTAGAAAPAWAGLTLCNRTPHDISAAVAFFPHDAPGTTTNQHRGGMVHGWYTVAAGACRLVARSIARDGQYYYFARTKPTATHTWRGSAFLCVRGRAFDEVQVFLMGGRVCGADYYSAGFVRAPAASGYEQTVNLILGG